MLLITYYSNYYIFICLWFYKEDADWFRPVELVTRNGRRGHIRESLGTHGLVKCVFDKQLRADDVVFLPLYKRVFPHWSFDPHVRPLTAESSLHDFSAPDAAISDLFA